VNSATGHRPSFIGAAFVVVALLASAALPLGAQASPKPPAPAAADARDTMAASASPVVLDGDTLFFLFDGTSAYSSADRAKRVSTALLNVAKKGVGAGDSVRVYSDARRTEVSLGSQPLFFVTDSDAKAVGLTRDAAAELYAKRVRGMLPLAAAERTAGAMWRDVGTAATQTGIALVLVLIARLIFPRLLRALDRSRTKLTDFIAGLGIGGLSADRVVDFLLGLTGLARWVFYTVLVAVYVPTVLSDFPQTADFALRLIASVAVPLKGAANAVVDYLPDLVVLVIIGFGARVVLRGVRAFFNAVRAGNIKIQNFEREWAAPTFQIARALIVALAFALMFPYLPGANSDAIKGVSIFLGVLVSFGSSSAISNLVAGLVLLYSRAFHVGDWVRIGTVEGSVIARSLLVTRLRTPKNVEISVPNAVVLAGPIENFTAQAELGKLILHTTVTIGYDAPWRTVHELLIAAAHATAYIESDPAPFVLQTGLGDFNVAYQLNAFTTRADLQPAIYGDLHSNIQEKFNAAGVEIMSPNFFALRDGNTVTIPESQRPASYRAPTFRVSTDTK
jgi:small-conductance mechanosensitive channel